MCRFALDGAAVSSDSFRSPHRRSFYSNPNLCASDTMLSCVFICSFRTPLPRFCWADAKKLIPARAPPPSPSPFSGGDLPDPRASYTYHNTSSTICSRSSLTTRAFENGCGWNGRTSLAGGGVRVEKHQQSLWPRRRWIQYWVPLETFTQAVLPLRWRPLASNVFEAGFVVILSLIANDDVHDKQR